MSEQSKEANEKRSQFWKNHLKEWSQTGLSQNVYCRNNNLRPNQFTYWKNKFKRQSLPVEFVQITQNQFEEVTRPPAKPEACIVNRSKRS